MAQPELVIQLEEKIDPEGSQANLEGVDDPEEPQTNQILTARQLN